MAAIKAFALFWALGVFAVLVASRSSDFTTVRGQLSWDSEGFAVVSECATARVLRFGVMASAPYVALRRRYDDLSQGGKMPVLIEVKGVLARSSSGKELLDSPGEFALSPGTCD